MTSDPKAATALSTNPSANPSANPSPERSDAPLLECASLCVERGGRPVLQDVSFSLTAGEIYALLGGNGAGKSSTLLTLVGLLTPSSGDARIFGQSVAADPVAARRRVAYLPESAALYEHLTARENLRYLLRLSRLSRSDDELEAALDRVSLQPDARGRALGGYSKGMRQKTAIALAILRQASVLLLDEPTSGLDPLAVDEFHALIDDLSSAGAAVLMVTHDLYGACQVAQRLGLLRQGQIVGRFTADDAATIDVQAVRDLFTRAVAP